MIVVVIIGMLATMAVALFGKVRQNSVVATFANDLRVFKSAMEVYALDNGDYPADTGPGTAPADFLEYLPPNFMETQTPIGGLWDIDIDAAAGVTAAVGVGNLNEPNMDVILQIDKRVDDGDLSSGSFLWLPVDGGRPYWIVEE